MENGHVLQEGKSTQSLLGGGEVGVRAEQESVRAEERRGGRAKTGWDEREGLVATLGVWGAPFYPGWCFGELLSPVFCDDPGASGEESAGQPGAGLWEPGLPWPQNVSEQRAMAMQPPLGWETVSLRCHQRCPRALMTVLQESKGGRPFDSWSILKGMEVRALCTGPCGNAWLLPSPASC